MNNKDHVKKGKEFVHKLVRDKIPELIENDDIVEKIQLTEKGKQYHLLRKLDEELDEFHRAISLLETQNGIKNLVEEAADVIEVIEEITISLGETSRTGLYAIKEAKKEERGGFKQGNFIVWHNDPLKAELGELGE